jgi:hypothetical protein
MTLLKLKKSFSNNTRKMRREMKDLGRNKIKRIRFKLKWTLRKDKGLK